MAYIQIENFGNKAVRGLKFNQLSLEVFTKNLDYSHGSVSTTIYATFFAGLVGNVYVKEEDVDFTFEEVTDWVDKLYEDQRIDDIKKVCDEWESTSVYRMWLKDFQERIRTILEPEEKKVIKKKVK